MYRIIKRPKMKSKNNKTITNKKEERIRKFSYVFVFLLTAVLIGIAINNQYNTKKEKEAFNWASGRIKFVQRDIDGAVNVAQKSEITKYCYYGDHASAYDKGFLRCRVELSGSFESTDIEDDIELITNIAENDKYFGVGEEPFIPELKGELIPKYNLICGHEIESTSNYSNLSDEQKKKAPQIIYKIYCDSRATKALYDIE